MVKQAPTCSGLASFRSATRIENEAKRPDSKRAGIVMGLLRKLASEQDACIIAVTHDEKILDRFDRLFHLRDGRLANDKGDKP